MHFEGNFINKYQNFRWHLVSVGIIPPKRPFAYTQISCYIDGHQRLGATIKLGSFTDVRKMFCFIF